MDFPISPRPANRIPPGRLWFGASAGAVAWAVQGFTCLLLTSQACADGSGRLGPFSPAGVHVLIGAVSLILFAVAAAGDVTAYRIWRGLSEQRRLIDDEAVGREEFMALVGIFLNSAFLIGIFWAGLPALLTDICNSAR